MLLVVLVDGLEACIIALQQLYLSQICLLAGV